MKFPTTVWKDCELSRGSYSSCLCVTQVPVAIASEKPLGNFVCNNPPISDASSLSLRGLVIVLIIKAAWSHQWTLKTRKTRTWFRSMNLAKTVPDPKIFVNEQVENKSTNNIRMAAIYFNFRKVKFHDVKFTLCLLRFHFLWEVGKFALVSELLALCLRMHRSR